MTAPRHDQSTAVDVQLLAGRLDWLTALAVSDEVFTEQFGLPVAPGWLGFPELRSGLPASLSVPTTEHPWGTYLFIVRDTLVGFGGFKGAPQDGWVEIGYAVAPSWQGRGVATTATRAMIQMARTAGVASVRAHTLPEDNASTAVLTKCGFTRTEVRADPDGRVGGPVWRWERKLT